MFQEQLNILLIQKMKENNLYNIGYIGIGKYNSGTKTYNIWTSILRRCYDLNFKKSSHFDCFICPEWTNFQVFAEWYENNYIDGFHLDKDILVKGNKIYGPETCCFVPQQINNLFVKPKIEKELPVGIVLTKFNKYQVRIKKFGKHISLGNFNNLDDAILAYKKGKEKQIKELAEIWKDKLVKKVYDILINYEI
jgi:hypothetical protein